MAEPRRDTSRFGKDNDFFVVGIGASAGGLEALESFFDNMAEGEGLAFVVVQHLSPDYKSLMVELLSRHTRMRVVKAEDGMTVEPGTVYLIPRRRNITMADGRLRLSEQEEGLNLPIDIFLRSLAEDKAERAVGIILSGTGSDGTRGIRAIKEAGGMVMVQDDASSRFDGMPKSAIATGIVDYILPPERMPEELVSYTRGGFALSLGHDEGLAAGADALTRILSSIKSRTDIDFSYYKQSTVLRRVERRMGINQIADVNEYVRYLQDYPAEAVTLSKEILIGVTKFFRDSGAFRVVEQDVLPELFASKREHEAVRVWVAGCSTGEEAYSLAILLTEYCRDHGLGENIKVFATDIDRDALDFASRGIYPESIAADATMERLGKFFVKKGESYQISPAIREKVVFAYQNIIKDPPFGRIDLISCRNLLIYLEPVLQKKVLNNFRFSLNDEGFLFLGNSETVGDFSSLFTTFDIKCKVYRYVGGAPRELGDFSVAEHSPRSRPDLHGIAPRPARERGREMDDVYGRMVEAVLPSSVLLNDNKEVLHLFGDVGSYLHLPSGQMDLDVLKMADEELSIPLATALDRAIREQRVVSYKNVVVSGGEGKRTADLTVRPFTARRGGRYCLVSFTPAGESGQDAAVQESFDLEENTRLRIRDLEGELQHTKENLQATIEELETSNEELQATNEELLAANEELQSTNEELQSVNEELITVNSEYQKKIEELTELNDDMNNLFSSTDIGTIFLDNELTIRKFTPPVSRQINIISTDLGRPISHLSHNMRYDTLVQDVEEVMDSLKAKELEVQNNEGRWLLLKILPYRSAVERITGAVLSLVDITQRKEAEERITRERDLLLRVFKTSPVATLMLDEAGRPGWVNPQAEELFGYTMAEFAELRYDSEQLRMLDMDGEPLAREELPFARIRADGRDLRDYLHRFVRPDGTDIVVSVTGSPMFDDDGRVVGAVFKAEDVTAEHGTLADINAGTDAS